MTKKLFIILAMALAMISAVSAEAASRCTCIVSTGTTQYRCTEHGNYCVGIQQHQHEDARIIYRDIPVLCEIDGGFLLIDPNGPSAKEVRRELRRQARLQRRHEREIARAYKRELRAERKARRNNPLYWIIDTIERETKREIKREVRHKKNKLRRKIKREIRHIF